MGLSRSAPPPAYRRLPSLASLCLESLMIGEMGALAMMDASSPGGGVLQIFFCRSLFPLDLQGPP